MEHRSKNSPRPSIVGDVDGIRVTPAWASVIAGLLLAFAAAGLKGLETSTRNSADIQHLKSDVRYIRARIDSVTQ